MKRILTVMMFMVLAGASLAADYQSQTMLNNSKMASYFNNTLVVNYQDDGNLIFQPADVALLARTLPKGTILEVIDERKVTTKLDLTKFPLLATVVNTSREVTLLARTFAKKGVQLVFFPDRELMTVIVGDQPFARLKVLTGLNENQKPVYDLSAKPIVYNAVLPPLKPGEYEFTGSTANYIYDPSADALVVPFGANLFKRDSVWCYFSGRNVYQLPKTISNDLDLPFGENAGRYFDITLDDQGKIAAARWGGNDYGQYVLFFSKTNEELEILGYCPGSSLTDLQGYLSTLADLLTTPGSDDKAANLDNRDDLQLSKEYYDFIISSGEVVGADLDPLACSYYRLYNNYPLTSKDLANIDPLIMEAFRAYQTHALPWLAWEQEKRAEFLGLVFSLKENSLRFKGEAAWYGRLAGDWPFWLKLRKALESDFVSLRIFSQENRRLMVRRWLENRLNYSAVWVQAPRPKSELTFNSFFQESRRILPFTEREQAALETIVRQAASGETTWLSLQSIDQLNSYNFGLLLNDMLGNLYRSHGCLHVSPRNSLLLYLLVQDGTKVKILDYSKKISAEAIAALPYIEDYINFEADLEPLKKRFAQYKDIEVDAYPGMKLWVFLDKNQPFAKMRLSVGPETAMRQVEDRDDQGRPLFEGAKAYPTTPGTYYIFNRTNDYQSRLYPVTTAVPMGGTMTKEKTGWFFTDRKGKRAKVPAEIQADLNSASDQKIYQYYDQVRNDKGELTQVKWGDHPFGKYVLMTSKDKRVQSPEYIHSSGLLIVEQRQLIDDLILMMVEPADSFEACVDQNDNFSFYRSCSQFVADPLGNNDELIDSLASGAYKIFYGLPLTTAEAAIVPADYLVVKNYLNKKPLTAQEVTLLINEGLARRQGKKIVYDLEKIRGVNFDNYQYVVSMVKNSNHYEALRTKWPELSKIRLAMLYDFKNMLINNVPIFQRFARELLVQRIDLKRVEQQGAFEFLVRLLNENKSGGDK